MFAQHTITGLVQDAQTKEPIIGASVVVKGTTRGIITDLNGKFSLSVSEGATIAVSFVGYTSRTVAVNGNNNLVIDLTEKSFSLDEVVVIGYGVQKKSDLTGAVSSVKADDIRNMPTTNVAQALQGKAAGIEIVQNSGSPGASTSVKIRGTGSVNNTDPLYIVDGIPLDDINFLSSDDIQSIEILKDAASSAIYGSRAANGVVLITTKSGSDSAKPKITANIYSGWQECWKKPDLMSKDDFPYFQDYADNLYTKTVLGSDGKLVINDAYKSMVANGTDWWDAVVRKGFMQKYALSVSGGSKNMNYYISGNYQLTDGIIKNSDYDRKNLVGKVNANLSKAVSIGLNFNYANEARDIIYEHGDYGVVKKALIFSPLAPTYNSYGEYITGTPLEVLRTQTYESNKDNLVAQLTLDWTIAKNLKFNTRASITSYNMKDKHFILGTSSDMIVGSNSYTVQNVNTKNTNFSWDNILSYNNTFNEKHNFSVVLGQTMETNSYQTSSASGLGYGGYEEGYNALNFAGYSNSVSGYSTGWRSLGFLGRLSYDYDGKYLFQSNFRADASSRFAKNRWGYFPSFSLGWKVTGEEFMKNIDWISFLKLRGGWGQLGNNRIGDNVYGTYVQSAGYYVYGETSKTLQQAMSIAQIGNENVTWERTQSFDFGFDLNLFSNKLTTSFDWFTKDTKDMLLSVPLAYYNGYASIPVQNAGSVNNKGIELQVAWKDKIGNVKYEVGGNITHIKNKVTSLGENNDPIYGGYISELGYVNKTVVGAPIGAFYGWKTDGIIQSNEDISKLPTFKTDYAFGPGDRKYVDINGDGIIDDNDKTFLGSPNPTLYYGFNINLEYKGFDLSMSFQGVTGNKIYNETKYYMYSDIATDGYTSNVYADYWDKVFRPTNTSGDYRSNWTANPKGNVPTPNTNSTITGFNFRNSDFYIEDGSYLRLKNIQLGYTFPNKMLQKIHINSLRIYASATNLLTFTKYSGLDPEIGKTLDQEDNNLYMGIDQGKYPQARTYTFGLIFDF